MKLNIGYIMPMAMGINSTKNQFPMPTRCAPQSHMLYGRIYPGRISAYRKDWNN